MAGELIGQPPEGWLTSQGLTSCRRCGLSISRRIRNAIHPRCGESPHQGQHVGRGLEPPSTITDDRLPTLSEIFLCNVLTKEHLPASLLPLAREEYGKVVARVLQHNRRDAWELAADNELKQKARRAWIEFFMFGKCVLRQAQRGKRPAQAYHFTQSLLYRWRAGDRYGLWTEAVAASDRRSRGKKARGRKEVYREVERLVSLGRFGEATRRLVSPGLASETPAVKARLLSKFPSRDEATDLAYDAVVQPPEIPLESIYASIYSFRKGAGPGPDGIRGDFLRDMIGQQSHDDSMARLFREARAAEAIPRPREARRAQQGPQSVR